MADFFPRFNPHRNTVREIYDEIAQSLTNLKMELLWILKHLNHGSNNEELKLKIEDMNNLLDSTIEAMQDTCMELRPVLLDDLGLIPAIEQQIQEIQKRTKIK